jgi:hypothetical protein
VSECAIADRRGRISRPLFPVRQSPHKANEYLRAAFRAMGIYLFDHSMVPPITHGGLCASMPAM